MKTQKIGQQHTASDEVMVELLPFLDEPKRRMVWSAEDATQSDTNDHKSFVLIRNGEIADSSAVEAWILGNVAQGRMAGSAWDDIDKYFADEESGLATGLSLEARPGGDMVLVDKRTAGETQIGSAAQGRMAAQNPFATSEELEAIKLIDPTNVEDWKRIEFGTIHGLQFRFRSRLAHPGYFKFLALKTGNNEWRIAPIHPDIDDLLGHDHHMVTCSIGGHSVPVICGPGGRPATSLREARDFAYKWSTRIEGLLSGRFPRQSR